MSVESIREDAAILMEQDRRFEGLDPDSLPIEDWGPGFGPLIHLILGQQVSIEAADAMYRNLTEALGEVTPAGVLRLDAETLRRAGDAGRDFTPIGDEQTVDGLPVHQCLHTP